MPTFLFFRNATKIDMLRGADPNALEEKIKKWYSSEESEENAPVKGYVSTGHFKQIIYYRNNAYFFEGLNKQKQLV